MRSSPAAPPGRDLSSERRWLEAAELQAGHSGFADHATGRLAAGAAIYGDRWAELGLRRLLAELDEEAADLGAWGVLALQALERDEAVCATTRAQLAPHLEQAILAGACAHYALERARLTLERMTGARQRTFAPDVDGRCLHCERAYSAHLANRCSPSLPDLGRETR